METPACQSCWDIIKQFRQQKKVSWLQGLPHLTIYCPSASDKTDGVGIFEVDENMVHMEGQIH